MSTGRRLELLVLVLVSLLGVACRGCSGPGEQGPTLDVVADEVQFESVTRLGPHSLVAVVSRTRTPEEGTPQLTEETIEIAWKDWDNFRHRRLSAGELRSAVVVVDGVAWTRRLGASFERQDDAEPFRVALRNTWRIWDEALEQFADRIVLTEEGQTVVEGRAARRYAVSLAPHPEPKREQRERQSGLPFPESLEGFVVIDEATAVRLEIDVRGRLSETSGTRAVQLKASRTGIGEDPGLISPPEARRLRRKARKEAKAAPGAAGGKTEGTEEQDLGEAAEAAPAEGTP